MSGIATAFTDLSQPNEVARLNDFLSQLVTRPTVRMERGKLDLQGGAITLRVAPGYSNMDITIIGWPTAHVMFACHGFDDNVAVVASKTNGLKKGTVRLNNTSGSTQEFTVTYLSGGY